jgi:hypothetical protein
LADSLKDARRDLRDLLAASSLTMPGGIYPAEPSPGTASAPYLAVSSAGADDAFYSVTLRLYVSPGIGGEEAQDQLDDLANATELVLVGQSTFGPPGWKSTYNEVLDLLVAEWQLTTHRST